MVFSSRLPATNSVITRPSGKPASEPSEILIEGTYFVGLSTIELMADFSTAAFVNGNVNNAPVDHASN